MATVDALAGLGYEVDMVCYGIGQDPAGRKYTITRAARPFGMQSVKIGPSPSKILFDIPLYFRAAEMVRRNRYAVIHGVEEAGFMASSLGRRHRIPYIYDMHSWMSQQIEGTKYGKWSLPLKLFRRLELNAMRQAGAILTVGAEMTRLLQTSLAPHVHSATLPDCPLDFREPADPERARQIRAHYFPAGRKTVVYTGNFHVYQGIDLLIDAIAELKKRVGGSFPFALLLVGGGKGEQARIDQCRARVKDLGLQEEVVFCGEYPMQEIPVFMESADLLVSSRTTGNNVPLKIYTFLAAGIPMVATRVPSHTQVLTDENCLLAEPTPAGLAQALYRGLAELKEDERARIVAAARKITPAEQRAAFAEVLRVSYERCRASGSR